MLVNLAALLFRLAFWALGLAVRHPKRAILAVILLVAAAGGGSQIAQGGPAATLATTSATPGDPFQGGCRPAVTQPYGPTDVQGEPMIDGVRFHTGIDLACPAGTAVYAVTAGGAQVTYASGGFGNNVVVGYRAADGSGAWYVRYGHLAAVAVGSGASVQAGELLGWEGSTGFSSGPHLHFEVDHGAPSVGDSVNPGPWLAGF